MKRRIGTTAASEALRDGVPGKDFVCAETHVS